MHHVLHLGTDSSSGWSRLGERGIVVTLMCVRSD